MSKNKQPHADIADIIISGGGIAGLTLALLLGNEGMKVHLIDPAPPPKPGAIKPNGRTVALMQSSLDVLKASGVWDDIEPLATPLREMCIIDDSIKGHPPQRTDFPAADIGMEAFGANIPNGKLRSILFSHARASKNITLHTPDMLNSYKVDASNIEATLNSGKILRAPLIIGADGRNSAVRKMAGIKCRASDYKQSAITCLINHSRSHNNTSTEFHRTDGPLALVPLPGNQSSVVWVTRPDTADELLRLDKDSFTRALQGKTLDILGGITLETPPESWPLSSLKAERLTAPRCALVAEAAHVISPITAQGLNLSLRDVRALAETISDAHKLGLDYGSAATLNAYEKQRRLDITARVRGVNSLNAIVSSDIMALKTARRTGLKILDNVLPLKKIAMRTGLTAK